MPSLKANRFDWDASSVRHLARHSVKPAEFEQAVTNGAVAVLSELDEQSGEERFKEIGHTDAGRVLVIAWIERDGMIRAVTAFPVSRQDCEDYYKERGKAL